MKPSTLELIAKLARWRREWEAKNIYYTKLEKAARTDLHQTDAKKEPVVWIGGVPKDIIR